MTSHTDSLAPCELGGCPFNGSMTSQPVTLVSVRGQEVIEHLVCQGCTSSEIAVSGLSGGKRLLRDDYHILSECGHLRLAPAI